MNALKSIKLSLPVDEIRNEEAINSTQNKISFLLYRLSSILQDIYLLYLIRRFVTELIDYVRLNARKSRAPIREKLHQCQSAKT